MVLSDDARMISGAAVEFPLVNDDDQALDVRAAIDHVRTTVVAAMVRLRETPTRTFDSRANLIVEASTTGFSASADAVGFDRDLFSLFSLLTIGGGALWFEDVYTVAGFMLAGAKCRLYINPTGGDEVHGTCKQRHELLAPAHPAGCTAPRTATPRRSPGAGRRSGGQAGRRPGRGAHRQVSTQRSRPARTRTVSVASSPYAAEDGRSAAELNQGAAHGAR